MIYANKYSKLKNNLNNIKKNNLIMILQQILNIKKANFSKFISYNNNLK